MMKLTGDVISVCKAGGGEIVSFNYFAYGETVVTEGTLDPSFVFRYRGYYYDRDLGLYLLGSLISGSYSLN